MVDVVVGGRARRNDVSAGETGGTHSVAGSRASQASRGEASGSDESAEHCEAHRIDPKRCQAIQEKQRQRDELCAPGDDSATPYRGRHCGTGETSGDESAANRRQAWGDCDENSAAHDRAEKSDDQHGAAIQPTLGNPTACPYDRADAQPGDDTRLHESVCEESVPASG